MTFKSTSPEVRAAKAVAYYMQRGRPFTVSAVQRRARTLHVFRLLMVEWKEGRLSGCIREDARRGYPESVFQPIQRRA